MKKRILSIFVVLAVLLSLFVVPASAAGAITLTVSSPAAQPGGDVSVTISVSNNTGLASLKFSVAYDSALTLKNITFNSAFGAYATAPTPYKNPEPITMISPLSDVTANGVFATLTFSVSANAQYGHKAPITISYSADDIFDGNYETVSVSVRNGSVTVVCPHSDTKNVPEKPATCSEAGYTAGVYCNDCQTYISGHTIVAATGNHNWDKGTVTKEASCKEEGSKLFTCGTCKSTKTEALPKTTDHKYGEWTSVDGENHKHTCSVCQGTETADHTWNAGTVTKQPSCAEEGVKTYTCTGCSVTKTEAIEKTTDHKYSAWTGADGENHQRTCSVCQDTVVAAHAWNKGVVTKKATCAEEGVKTFTCTDCSATYTEAIEKTTDHKYGKWTNEDGENHKHTCSVCQGSETAAHTWNKGVVTKKVTCKEEGETTYTCTGCGATRTDVIEKTTDHKFGKWTEADEATHKRNCSVCELEETGNHNHGTNWSSDKTRHYHACAECGHKKDAQEHTPGAAATETTAQRCTVCNYIITPALGHKHSYAQAWTTDETGHWYVCSGCEEKGQYAEHVFDNACDTDCSACGYTREISHDFAAEWTSDTAKHWHVCSVCGLIVDEGAHEAGPEATEETDQTCTICGYVITPALGASTTEPTVTETTAVPTEPPVTVPVPGGEEPSGNGQFPWWILLVILAIAVILFMIFKKKKKA